MPGTIHVNLPPLVLKARHLGGSASCNVDRLGVPKQALGGIPLDFGIVMENKPSELSCVCTCRPELLDMAG